MENPRARLELTPEASAFVDEWLSPLPYVEAHTSGSTGAPKAIRLLKDDMRWSARATLDFFGLGEGSTLLLPLEPSYIAGKMQIVRAIEGGCRLIAEHASRQPFATSAEITPSSMIAIVPAQIEGLMESPLFGMIGAVIVGGAPTPPHLERMLTETGVNAYATYGMTETCSHVALRRFGEDLFHGLPGFTFTTTDDGCLVIESAHMSFGRLVTNDVVELMDGNVFRFLGRKDNVINSGGIKIHPEEIEEHLLPALPAGYSAYITSRPSHKWGEEAVIVTDWPDLTMTAVSAILNGLPHRMMPKDVIYRSILPRTATGKIIRQRIR